MVTLGMYTDFYLVYEGLCYNRVFTTVTNGKMCFLVHIF